MELPARFLFQNRQFRFRLEDRLTRQTNQHTHLRESRGNVEAPPHLPECETGRAPIGIDKLLAAR